MDTGRSSKMRVSTYIVGWVDENTDWHTEYIQALNARQAIEILGIDRDKVQEVAKVLKEW